MSADPTDEPLGQNGNNGRGHEKCFDLHVKETYNTPNAVLGMKRRQNFVAGQRSLNGCFSRKVVAYFANNDHVWILADDMFQRVLERQSDSRIDGTLCHALDDI